ncbi:HNH endonuclease [Megamonas funiformis]|uniref:HNH endonuclease n=1 Tax=Megamonas funiformis TaxID=437897 RepID=UPI001CC62EC3|nr:HNH endonuclease [Megamonas funiformis]BDA10101.1 hypothetical protein MU1CBH_11290 [Megamonas funiformis]
MCNSQDLIPIKQIIPKHSYTGEKWKTYRTNKKYLAIDFSHRCAYCDDSDEFKGKDTYQVEHFAPKNKFPDLEYTYDNLLYACSYCNGAKSNKWVGKTAEENIKNDEGFINPCSDEYNLHLKRKLTGEIVPVTPLGLYMYKNLKLYLKRHQILYKLKVYSTKIDELNNVITKKKSDNKNIGKKLLEEELLSHLLKDFYFYIKMLSENN